GAAAMMVYSAIVRRRRPVMLLTIIAEWETRNQGVHLRRLTTAAQLAKLPHKRWAVIFAVIPLLAAQMVSTGAKDRPGLPLPPGMKPPVADFRDLAEEAGLKAVIVSGEFKQKYL